MLLLPEQSHDVRPEWEKIYTYLKLSRAGCPVLKSALILPNEVIDSNLIKRLKDYLQSDYATIRYQYIQSNSTPVVTGNRYKLSEGILSSLKTNDAMIWVLEPLEREKCNYGILVRIAHDICTIEIVGRGFDASDLTRGRSSPHEVIISGLPVRYGLYNEWWKFLKILIYEDAYQDGKTRRLQQLSSMGYNHITNIFDKNYLPLSYERLEKLLYYIARIESFVGKSEGDYCVACAFYKDRIIFWDIQTPSDKMLRYGITNSSFISNSS